MGEYKPPARRKPPVSSPNIWSAKYTQPNPFEQGLIMLSGYAGALSLYNDFKGYAQPSHRLANIAALLMAAGLARPAYANRKNFKAHMRKHWKKYVAGAATLAAPFAFQRVRGVAKSVKHGADSKRAGQVWKALKGKGVFRRNMPKDKYERLILIGRY